MILIAAAILAASPTPLLTIAGPAAASVTLEAQDLAALPVAIVRWTSHGAILTCNGAWLIDVLAKAGLPTGDTVRGAALTTIVIATGRDGYRAAFTLGELDRKLGNGQVIVADRCNGSTLSNDDGPLRLVAAADTRDARSVRHLVRLTIERR